jgi:thioredoxin reductase
MYDVIIIGAGPAGLTAGIYTARRNLKTLVLTKEIPAVSSEGPEGKGMESIILNFKQLLEVPSERFLELKKETTVVALEKNIVSFSVEDQTGKIYYARSVLVASGADPVTGYGNTEFDLLTQKDSLNKIKVNCDLLSSVEGIAAAGAANNSSYKDMFVTSAEGGKAALLLADYLKTLK